MTRRTTLGTLACLLALMLPALASAQSGKATIYKWTDAEGKVHFSQQPPPDQAATVEVKRKNRTEPVGESSTASTPAAKPAVPATAAAEEETAQPQKDPAICEKARNNLEQLRDRRFVVVRDEYGEESILSEERVAQEIQRAEAAVSTHCS